MDPISRLPAEAMTKYTLVQMEAIDARDAATDASHRLRDAERMLDAETPHMRERIASLRNRLRNEQDRAGTMRTLMTGLDLYLSRLANNAAVSVAPFDKRQLPKKLLAKGEDAATAVATLREKIAEVQGKIVVTQNAPIKGATKREAIKRYLDSLSAKGTPQVRVAHNGEVSIRLGASVDSVALADARGHHLFGMMLNLFGQAAILDKLAPHEQERAGALTPQQRDEQLSALRAELLMLERAEEYFIEGSGILRRADADPRAILGIEAPRLRQAIAA